jgi:beta-lactamase class A
MYTLGGDQMSKTADRAYTPFYRTTDRTEALGTKLVEWAIDTYESRGLARELFALTWLPSDRALSAAAGQPDGFSFRGSQPFYPCSVVKVFYLAAAEARLEDGAIQPHGELDRAMHDMIRWSSNAGTNYVIDLVTGTTGDTLLDEAGMRDWVEKRQWVNDHLRSFGWPEFIPINVCQKLMDDDRYGREKVFSRMGGNNHNRLTADAAARMFHAIFTERAVSPARSRHMAELLARPLDPSFAGLPAAQVKGYFGAGLPKDAKLWSKAGWTGWTGDANASYRRHDAAYVELPGGPSSILVAFTQGQQISANEDFLPDLAAMACRLMAG